MTYAKTKNDAKNKLEKAREKYLSKLKKSKAYKKAQKLVEDFENSQDDLRNNYSLDESGLLVCQKELELDDSLTHDDSGEPDQELTREVCDSLSEVIRVYPNPYHKNTITMENCFGDACIFNASPERGHYAIYSRELKLKIDKVENETHGFLLIEQAMRKNGVFPYLVSCDRYGNCFPLTMPKEITSMTDAQLVEGINQIETEFYECPF